MNKRKYTKITLLIIPISIIILNIILFIALHLYVNQPTYDKKQVNDNTTIEKIYKVVEIKQDDASYIVYSLEDKCVDEKDEYLIAFKGNSIEEIEEKIVDSDNVLLTIFSYWNGENIIEIKDFSNEKNTIEYIDSYISDNEETYVLSLMKEVKVYDLSSYIGHEDNGEDLVLLIEFGIMAILFQFSLIIIGLEILITTILKYTILKNKFVN